VLVLDNHLAVKDGRLARQLRSLRDNGSVLPRPIMAVAREGARAVPLDRKNGAVAVIFDFVDPASASGGSSTSVGIMGAMKPGETRRAGTT
jgi:hypothetical protein